MRKFSMTIYFFSLVSIICHCAAAQTDAADAAAIFREAEAFITTLAQVDDADVKNAVKTLQNTIDKGNQLLLNQKVSEAKGLARQADAQMELVRLLIRLAETKVRLRQLQSTAQSLKKKASQLKGQHRRLLLEQDGRAMTGAYPAPNENAGGER